MNTTSATKCERQAAAIALQNAADGAEERAIVARAAVRARPHDAILRTISERAERLADEAAAEAIAAGCDL